MKKEVPLPTANRLINSGPVILVTAHHKGRSNIITLAWQTPVSHVPPLVAISVGRTRYSHDLIARSGEFVVNVPTRELLAKLDYCGSVSGRDVDKFKETGLTARPARVVRAPLIQECAGHLECKLSSSLPTGDHTIFIGEVVAASVEDALFDGYWLVDQAKTIHHLGGEMYTFPDTRVNAAGVRDS